MKPMKKGPWQAFIIFMFLWGVAHQAQAEAIVPTHEQLEFNVKITWFDSRIELAAWLKRKGCDNCAGTRGISLCKEGETCHLYMVRPRKVDDKYTCVIGHEFLHGAFGRYHEEWYLED